jgi:hypothetical protein
MHPHFLLLAHWFLFIDDDGFNQEPTVFRKYFFEDGVDRLAKVVVYVV